MKNKSILLANSIWFNNNTGEEILANNTWITDKLEKIGYPISKPLSSSCLKDLLTLRTIILEILSNKDISSKQTIINTYLAKATYTPMIINKDDTTLNLWKCESNEEDQLISEITQDLVTLFSENIIEHVKTCSNDECKDYFLDNSKNKSKKFCSSKCGNLIKVRRHRAK